MSHFVMGAFNKDKKYILPQNAVKGEIYQCPECSEEIILKKGSIRAHHFSHKKDSSCKHFDKPSESYQHLAAKHLIKNTLESSDIVISRECSECKNKISFTLPQCDNVKHSVELEYRFKLDYYDRKTLNKKIKIDEDIKCKKVCIADIAVLNKEENTISNIIEIFYTHKTETSNRGEPWFEFDAKKVLLAENESNKFDCIRQGEICETCIPKKFQNLILNIRSIKTWSDKDSEFYVRYKLGQRIFSAGNWSGEHHNKFDYHCEDLESNLDNDNIINLFSHLFRISGSKKIITSAWKGTMQVYLVDKNYNALKIYGHYALRDSEIGDILPRGIEGTVQDLKSILKRLII